MMNNLTKAFGGGSLSSSMGMLQPWEIQEGLHTPSGSKTPIVMCGWLYKMKGGEHHNFRSIWSRRWFTVEDGALHWYKTPSSDACGRLLLTDIRKVRRFDSSGSRVGGGWHGGGHGSFVFVVSETDREMTLRADKDSDGNRWIRGLTLQIDLIHGGTFQGPPSNKNRRRGATVVRTGNVSGEVEIGGGSKGINIGTSEKSTPSSSMGHQEEGASGGKWRWSGKIVPVNSPKSRAGRYGCDVETRDDTLGPTGGEGEDNQQRPRKGEHIRASKQQQEKKQPSLPHGPPPIHGRNGSSRLRSSKSASSASSEGNIYMFHSDMDGNHGKTCHDEGREGREVDGEKEWASWRLQRRQQRQEERSRSVADSPQSQRWDSGEEEGDCDGREGTADSRDNWQGGGQCSEARRSVDSLSPKSGSSSGGRTSGSCRRRKPRHRHQQQKKLYDDVDGANSLPDGSADIIENSSIEEEEVFSVDTARRSVSSPLHGTDRNKNDSDSYDGYSRYQRRHSVTDVPSSRASPLAEEIRTVYGRTFDSMKEVNEDSGMCIHPRKIPLKKQSNFWLRKGCDTGAGSTPPRESSTGNGTWSMDVKVNGCYDYDETPPTSGLGSSGRSSSRSSGSQRTPRRYLVEQNRYRQGW